MRVSPQPKQRKVVLQYIEALILVTHNSSESWMNGEKISMLSSKKNGVDNQVIVLVSISIKKLSLMSMTCVKGHPRDGCQMLAVISFMLSKSSASHATHHLKDPVS